jgi:hypothetical protein
MLILRANIEDGLTLGFSCSYYAIQFWGLGNSVVYIVE